MSSKYAGLGNLAECWRCQDSVQTYPAPDGQTIVLDVRPAPTCLVPAELRWRVNGNGFALPLGWADPTDTIRITHDPICVGSSRTDLGRLRAHLDEEHIIAQGLATVIAVLGKLMTYQDLHPTADDIRTVRCPVCGAAPDTSCTSLGGQRRPSNHKDRVTEFREARYDTSPWHDWPAGRLVSFRPRAHRSAPLPAPAAWLGPASPAGRNHRTVFAPPTTRIA
ncbi:DUF6083 domain-containing protein [Streptomyces sp. TE33382]